MGGTLTSDVVMETMESKSKSMPIDAIQFDRRWPAFAWFLCIALAAKCGWHIREVQLINESNR